MTRSYVRVFGLLILLCVVGCRRDAQQGAAKNEGTAEPEDVVKNEDRALTEPPPADVTSEVDRLRSLGYVDYSQEPAALDEMGVTVFDETRSYPGYNLYTVLHSRLAELIDSRGRVVNSWQQGEQGYWLRSVLLENGDLLVLGEQPPEGLDTRSTLPKRFVMRLTWDNKVIWKRMMSAHHDIIPTPDGRLALLTHKLYNVSEADRNVRVRDDHVTIMSHDGEVLEERPLDKMLSARPDVFTFMEFEAAPTLRNPLHSNSLRWMTHEHLAAKDPIYAPGNVIICFRHQNTVAIFDWEREEVIWAWGQGQVSEPHDAVVLESGNILLFDNGVGRDWSRVIELDPLTKEIVWQYRAPNPTDFYTVARGASQRLPNGNTLITESNDGRAFEVTRQGEIVWEYFIPHLNPKGHRGVIVRLYRYERAFVNRIVTKEGKP